MIEPSADGGQAGLVAALANGDPIVWRALLSAHGSDADGRCRACTVGGQSGRQRWPCTLYALADSARSMCQAGRFWGLYQSTESPGPR